jgi:lysophospholipase L1-like esterase
MSTHTSDTRRLPRPRSRGLYYFDLVWIAAVLIVVAGWLLLITRPHVSWNTREIAAAIAFAAALAGLLAFRLTAYTQRGPWIVLVFAAVALAATALTFWPLDMATSFIACGVMSAALLGGLVLRSKPLHEPLQRLDVFKLIALAASVGASVVLAELMLRAGIGAFSLEMQQVLRADPRNYGVAHPYIGHLHKPDATIVISGRDFSASHHTDRNGFRNPWPWPSQAGVVVVGDSVTFGYGVSDNEAWPAILAAGLTPERMINLGLIGAGPQQYARVYETFGAGLRPKLVIVGFLAGNDFWDADAFDNWIKSGTGGNYMVWRDFGRPPRPSVSLRDPLGSLDNLFRSHVYPQVRRSYIYNLLRSLRSVFESRQSLVYRFPDGHQIQLSPAVLSDEAVAAQSAQPEFQLATDALVRLSALTAQSNGRLLVVLQPGKEEVYLPLLGEQPADAHRALRDALDAAGIEYLDLTPGFRQRAATGARLFFEVDGHPNAAGYALIGELVLAHVREHRKRYGLAD